MTIVEKANSATEKQQPVEKTSEINVTSSSEKQMEGESSGNDVVMDKDDQNKSAVNVNTGPVKDIRVLNLTKKIFLSFPIKSEEQNSEDTTDVCLDKSCGSVEKKDTEVMLYISPEGNLYSASQLEKHNEDIDKKSLLKEDGVVYFIKPLKDEELCDLIFEYLDLIKQEPKGLFTLDIAGSLMRTGNKQDVKSEPQSMYMMEAAVDQSTSSTSQQGEVIVKEEPEEHEEEEEEEEDEEEDEDDIEQLQSLQSGGGLTGQLRVKVLQSLYNKSRFQKKTTAPTEMTKTPKRRARKTKRPKAPAGKTESHENLSSTTEMKSIKMKAGRKRKPGNRLIIDHLTGLSIIQMKMNMQITNDIVNKNSQVVPSTKKSRKDATDTILTSPGKSLQSDKLLKIYDSCLVTRTSPDSDDELEDLGLQELPDNAPKYATYCDDTEFLSEDDLDSETSSVTGNMTPTFPMEKSYVNKNSEYIYKKSKRMEERKKEDESVTMPIDPSQIKTEHPDIFDIDSLVHTINRNSDICPRKFNRSYRDIETEIIMTEITGSQTGSSVQKETVVNIKKEPYSSPIKGLMEIAMQKGLENRDQWGNFSEFDIDSVVNVVNRKDEGRLLADSHTSIVKVEDQGRQLEDGIVNFVNRENHGRQLGDGYTNIVKEEIQGRQLEEEAYFGMDDIESLVHFTNRKSHSVSPSKNNASQQPSLSAKPQTIVGLRLTEENKGSKSPNKKGDNSLALSPQMKKNYKIKDCFVVMDTDIDIQSKMINLQKNAASGKEIMSKSEHDLKRSGGVSDLENIAKKPKIGPKCMKRQDKDVVKDHKKSKFVIDHKAKVLKLNLSRLDKNLKANETDKEINNEVTKKIEIENERRKEKSHPKHKEESEIESKQTKISVENKEKERSDNESRHIKSSTDGNRKQDRKHENDSREYSDKHKHSEKPKHPHSEKHKHGSSEKPKLGQSEKHKHGNSEKHKHEYSEKSKHGQSDKHKHGNSEKHKEVKGENSEKNKNFPDKSGSKKGKDDKHIKSSKSLKRKADEDESIASKKSKHDDKTENCDEKKDSLKKHETKMISVEIKKKEHRKEEKLNDSSKKLNKNLSDASKTIELTMKCKLCKEIHSSKSALEKHMISVHNTKLGRKRFGCKLCTQSFDTTSFLIKHIESHKEERKKSGEEKGNTETVETNKREGNGKTETVETKTREQKGKTETIETKIREQKGKTEIKETKTREEKGKAETVKIKTREQKGETETKIREQKGKTETKIREQKGKIETVESEIRREKLAISHVSDKKEGTTKITDDIKKGEKSHQEHKCVVCNEVFTASRLLAQHMKKHSNLQCSICDKYFKSKKELENHEKSHTKGNNSNNHTKSSMQIKDEDENEPVSNNLDLSTTEKDKIPNNARFPCIKCSKIFAKEEEYENHMKTHMSLVTPELAGKSIFPCTKCSGLFTKKEDLLNHIKVHDDKVSKCDICHKIFPNDSELVEHKTFHNIPESLKCTVCYLSFQSSSELEEHVQTHKGQEKHKCDICFKSYTKFGGLEEHREKVHNIYSKKCIKCHVVFFSSLEYENHLETECVSKQNTCDVCMQIFKTESELQKHLQVHEERKDIVCSICSKKFDSLKELLNHKEVHMYQKCKICFKKFVSEDILNEHMKVHYGKNCQQCSICGKCFPSERLFKEHKDTDHPNATVKCDICQNTFKTFPELVNHMKKHEPEKFDCKDCDKSFNSSKQLSNHWKMEHNKGMSFMCGHCKIPFKTEKELTTHVKDCHDNVEYKCGLCEKIFLSEKKLTDHMNAHTAQFQCGICQKQFGEEEELLEHLNEHTFTSDVTPDVPENQAVLTHVPAVLPNVPVVSTVLPDVIPKVINLPCDNCGEKFTGQSALDNHVKTCKVVEEFQCGYCKCFFSSNNTLVQHIITHMAAPAYSCDICGEVSKSKADYDKHQHSSDKQRVFKCGICPFVGMTRNSLLKHLETHL
ncbi:zinc finger protein Xfin-like isoform X2 [Mytilus californianus]|uniref:zinc finger protein Xfin-like isoform X2 n=1 Tax=Mytilus californianus TaxID=6549 RepID=UPI002246BB42|nr:zinc finger protein Xfin-like isoform X2 [Mytilus californianus]